MLEKVDLKLAFVKLDFMMTTLKHKIVQNVDTLVGYALMQILVISAWDKVSINKDSLNFINYFGTILRFFFKA